MKGRKLSNASNRSTSRMSAPDMPSNRVSDDGYHVFDVGLMKGKKVVFVHTCLLLNIRCIAMA